MLPQQIIAGPILRHVSQQEFVVWFVTTQAVAGKVKIYNQRDVLSDTPLSEDVMTSFQVGTECFIHLLQLKLELPTDCLLHYDLEIEQNDSLVSLAKSQPELAYEGQSLPGFSVKPDINRVLHGSCRKPHHPQKDALLEVDKQLQASVDDQSNKPSLLMFSGDQVYVDDVAGPMLNAIHQLIAKLGLFDENLPDSPIGSFAELSSSDKCFYLREQLLPDDEQNQALLDTFFGGKRKPIFTSVGAQNHLITFAEVIAMYLLVWSDKPWQWVELGTVAERVPDKYKARYQQELKDIADFRDDLVVAKRPLANIPVYMMFDDHDVTDDWNLTRGWEEAAYTNPFSKRILGNALLGCYICQGLGNKPDNYAQLTDFITQCFKPDGIQSHSEAIDAVLEWNHWHFVLDTKPKVVVLDTRTHRWRSEDGPNEPSGLMDWESLSELQQELINQPSVIMVSPAPIYGVKLIEAIQRVFTFFGKPLMVDAENWMAHPGAASVLLNIFRHPKTPPNFIILSGDVHYSFAYDVTLRYRDNSPQILQITASGIKNAFPDKLLGWLDKTNLALFGSNSPLNWFTKRRQMKVKRRSPNGHKSRVLFNHSGIGDVIIADSIEETRVLIHASDGKTVEFK